MPRVSKYPELYDKSWLEEQYLEKELSDREIGKLLGCTNGNICIARKRLGISDSRPHFKKTDTGTKFVTHGGANTGYVFVYLPSHPDSKKGCIAEHRLVMEEKLGRRLNSNEIVHHINGNKSDNKPENLVLVKRGRSHALDEPCWILYRWAKDNPAEASALIEELKLRAPSETKRLDSDFGDAIVRTD